MIRECERLVAVIGEEDERQLIRKRRLRYLFSELSIVPETKWSASERARLQKVKEGAASIGQTIRAMVQAQRRPFTMPTLVAQVRREHPRLADRVPATYVGNLLLSLVRQGVINRTRKGGVYHYSVAR